MRKPDLILSILQNLPIPLIIIRLSRDPRTGSNFREVVDGQQRLKAILAFHDGELSINKIHNTTLDGFSYPDLTEDLRNVFMDYELAVNVLTGATNSEVLDIFARLNSYTVVLNRQEKLNAKYHGDFKTFAYKEANKRIEFFIENRILSNRRIMRMAEVELMSELIIAMLIGLQDKKSSIEEHYRDYDDEFTQKNMVADRMNVIFDKIHSILEDELKMTNFRRSALFYSLFCVFYDLIYGLPDQDTTTITINEDQYEIVKERILYIDEQMKVDNPIEPFIEFLSASSRSTDNIGPRTIRHNVIKTIIENALRTR